MRFLFLAGPGGGSNSGGFGPSQDGTVPGLSFEWLMNFFISFCNVCDRIWNFLNTPIYDSMLSLSETNGFIGTLFDWLFGLVELIGLDSFLNQWTYLEFFIGIGILLIIGYGLFKFFIR